MTAKESRRLKHSLLNLLNSTFRKQPAELKTREAPQIRSLIRSKPKSLGQNCSASASCPNANTAMTAKASSPRNRASIAVCISSTLHRAVHSRAGIDRGLVTISSITSRPLERCLCTARFWHRRRLNTHTDSAHRQVFLHVLSPVRPVWGQRARNRVSVRDVYLEQ